MVHEGKDGLLVDHWEVLKKGSGLLLTDQGLLICQIHLAAPGARPHPLHVKVIPCNILPILLNKIIIIIDSCLTRKKKKKGRLVGFEEFVGKADPKDLVVRIRQESCVVKYMKGNRLLLVHRHGRTGCGWN
jgi:hypothetical protein